MQIIWEVDGTIVYSVTSNKWNGTELTTYGYVTHNKQLYLWEALARPSGYYIIIHRWSNTKIGEFQGATFNLPLEISAAVRRLV